MKYLYSKSEHYIKFIESNKTNRIYKNLKIWTSGSKGNLFNISFGLNISEEIYEKPIDTDYSIIDMNDNFKKVIFKSKSNTEYRIDIHIINEFDKLINHISFTKNDDMYDIIPNNETDFKKYDIDYNKPTGKNEMIELLNRLHFILKDLVSKNIINNNFCIGGTELIEKNNIYEFFLKVIVGDGGFEKINTNVYPKVGWGLYFSI